MLVAGESEQPPLLSPPTSPRMSFFTTSPARTTREDGNPIATQNLGPVSTPSSSLAESEVPCPYHEPPTQERQPLLRSRKSFPHTTGARSRVRSLQRALLRDVNVDSRDSSSPSGLSGGRYTQINRSDPILSIRTRSGPASPNAQLTTPTSPQGLLDEAFDDDASMADSKDSEQEEEGSVEGDIPKTAAERQAEKRKMKRFRLTHNQTRYLMSEFTRQAHPDAAHRERLSREIPGLSPRQVQVWFQNRRAKLKRLTTDDRERILNSRALPEDFDMASSLYSPYGGQNSTETTLTSPAGFMRQPFDASSMRPPSIDTAQQQVQQASLPINLDPAYVGIFPPSASENVSPLSTTSDRSSYHGFHGSLDTSPRGSNPFIRSTNSSSIYYHPHFPHFQLQNRVNSRGRAESLQSPLNSNISYSIAEMGGAKSRTPSSTTAIFEPPRETREPANAFGIVYENAQLSAFQSLADAGSQYMPVAIPSSLQLRSEYRPSSTIGMLSSSETHSFPPQFSPQALPPNYHLNASNAPVSSTPFSITYAQCSAPSIVNRPATLYTHRNAGEHPRVTEITGDLLSESASYAAGGSYPDNFSLRDVQ